MDTPIQVDLGRIAQDLQIRRVQVESVVQLLDEGNTVPFMTRYRKERTGGLDERVIREIQLRVGRQRELTERKQTVLKSIEQQGKLSEELREAILTADSPKRLEDLYLPFKPKKKTKASEARARGLEPLALRIWNRDESLIDLHAAAADFVGPENGVESAEQALEGVGHILAESISELAPVRDAARRVVWRTGKLVTTKLETVAEGQGLDFRDYFNYSEPVNHVPPHRVLAINRGEKENVLRIRLELPREEVERALFSQLPLDGHPHQEFFTRSALDALDRLLLPSLEREVKRDLTEVAERHAVEVFARNLRSLLLQPPISRQIVLAIDPGFRTGCKVAVLDSFGAVLEHDVIHPHQPQNRKHEAKQRLKDLIGKHSVNVVAIGNGTACRETEEIIAEVIAEGTYFHQNPEATSYPGFKPRAEVPGTTAGSPEVASSTVASEVRAEPIPTSSPAAEDPGLALDATQSPPAVEPSVASEEAMAEVAASEIAGDPSTDVTPLDESRPQAAVPDSGIAPASNGEEEPRAGTDQSGPSEVMPPIQGGAPEESEAHEPKESEDLDPATLEAPRDTTVSQSTSESANEDATTPPGQVGTPEPEGPPPYSHEVGERASEGAGEPPVVEVEGGEPVSSHSPEPTNEVIPESAPTEAAVHESPAGEASPEVLSAGEPPAPPTGAQPASQAEESPPLEEVSVPPAEDFTHLPVGPKPKPAAEKPPRPARSKQPPAPPRPHLADALLSNLSYVIVNEAGASVYSASPVGREEFPDLDATTRGTISIGRRLLDPLAELVKIEPQNIGVGLYQHDVNPKELKESLETVIESCVNFVGVDLNTASVPLLRHVSGLNALTARRLVDRRAEKGPFASRDEIREIEGIGDKIFTQAAGFLKIRDGAHPLDRTWIHPESYETAAKLLEKFGLVPTDILDKEKLTQLNAQLAEADLSALASDLDVGESTLRDICDALVRPDRDPREDLPKPIFKRGVLKLEDLSPGMELKGTVLNVVDFGAFVDIGLKDSGLVHISQLANRYIKSPHDVVSVGDVVTAWVLGVDSDRKRVSLTMVEPGTERPRGPRRGGGGQEGGPPPRAEGGRRGGPRPPRREGGPASGRAQTGPPQGDAGSPPAPARNARVPGPPQRAQQARRGGPRRQGSGARFEGRPDRPEPSDRSTPPSKPKSPPPAAAPLSSDAIAGNAPLRTFGQLKQLFEMRTKGPDEDPPSEGRVEAQTPPDHPPAHEDPPTPTLGSAEGGEQRAEAGSPAEQPRSTSDSPTTNGNAGDEVRQPKPAEEGSSTQGDPSSGLGG